MNVEIGTETPIFLFWEYLFRNFGIFSFQCLSPTSFTRPYQPNLPLFILSLSFSSLSLSLPHLLSVFLFQGEREVKVWSLEGSYLCLGAWQGKGCWRLCLPRCEGEHPVSLQCRWEEIDGSCSQQGGQELPSPRDGKWGWLQNRKNITRL